jgi:mannose-1-phosphate guanylyltransferase
VRAVVLVGGIGTRLRPLTNDTPKQMLPIVNRPMIERVLAHLTEHGVEEAVLAMGYRPDAFRDAYGDGSCAGVRLHYAVEDEPLDTAGAIRFAAAAAGFADERLIVVNGDILTDLDLGELVALHERVGAEGTIALHRVDDPSAYGVVPTDETGRVLAFVEKPPRDEAPTDLINAGTYVLEPEALARIPVDRRTSIERETFPAMVADGVLYAMDDQTYWIDAGTLRTYARAQLDLLDGVRGAPEDGVHRAAQIDPTATVERSVIGPDAHVCGGATVVDSVVLGGATVGRDAHVRSCIVSPTDVLEVDV